MAQAFAPMAAAAGVEVPEAARRLAQALYVGREKSRPVPQKLVPRIVDALRGRDLLFLQGGEIVSWCESERTFKPMKPHAFCTWLPSSNGGQVVLHAGERDETDSDGAKTGKRILIESDLSVGQAQLVLASEDFRNSLPEVERVAPVCLPIYDATLKDERGRSMLRLCRHGYDAQAKTWTIGEVKYDETMDVRDAVEWVHDLVQHFAWRHKERDFAIWLAGLVSMFGRGLFGGRAPAFFANANIQESGKTNLMWLITWAIHGTRAIKALREDADDKLELLLDSTVLSGLPYVNFDNIKWKQPVGGDLLETFVQEDEHTIRKYHTQNVGGKHVNRVQVMGSGNNIKFSTDLERRGLMLDLWNPLAGTERRLPKDATLLDDEFFANEGNRQRMLSACWAMVREWDKAGRELKPGRLLGSFESWARFAPSVVWFTGKLFNQQWDCMIASGNEEIGDKQSRDFARLAQLAVKEYSLDAEGKEKERFEVLVRQFAGLARRHGLDAVTGYLWPETSIEAVMASKDFKTPQKKATAVPVEDVDSAWGDEEKGVDAETLLAASEYLGRESNAKFGKALKAQMNERHFRAADGSVWSFKNLAMANPRRLLVEKVSSAAG